MTAPSSPSGYKVKNVQQYTPEMMQLLQKLIGGLTGGGGLEGGLDFLSKLASGDEETFAGMEAPYYSALEKGLGQTASRFSQFGARDSSAFQQAVAGQSTDLAEKLGAQRSQMRKSAIDSLIELSGNLLSQRPFEPVLQEKGSGTDWGGIAKSGFEALPSILQLLKLFG